MGKVNCTILVVEDEAPLLRAIQKKLETNDYNVVTARTVEQALGLMEDIENIDLVWLDHYLLGKDTGLEFVKKIKENKAWAEIPIFLVTNTATSSKVHTYIGLGVDKYFIKSSARLDDIIDEIDTQICQLAKKK
jgi:CheY-like chemotaxis protein